ncbi:cyclic nucleotide-gated ion channel 1 isoform X2 [Ziziphus jujuba]|uniref:Cyclic nucleotide-gated ion channel 1 isoform X2 n=1 Tax=Ziziphus jujuba TaxID=326968 RepID=A0A6P6G0G7_ZIZJJ|nr:cyclic nucleotide-gated ion channel 1 isoform X2 [Ziziphus jujuba]
MDKEMDDSQDVRISMSDAERNIENELTKKDDVRAKIKKIFYPWGQHKYHLMLKNAFLVSCVIAISMDPLFLYIPYINEEKKCIQMDPKLKIAFLVYRCLTDISYLIHIFFHTLRRVTRPLRKTKYSGLIGETSPLFWRITWSFIQNYIDILAIIPLAQMMLIFFAKLRDSRYSSTRNFLNFLIISQYAPRILRVYLSWKNLGRIPTSITGVVWALGALWYFLAVEQETTCWGQACKTHGGCVDTSFVCNDNTTPRNLIILNEFCPINPPNATVYDFGIFLDGLQSGMQASTDFPKKFVQCFWWGLRNLSSFGQNLDTRNHAWESMFAALISITGLLLFLYLIGNLQTYMQLATTRWVEIRQKLKMKEPEIDLWISNNRFPKTKRTAVMQHILYSLEHDKDADVENLLNSLSSTDKERIESNLTLGEHQSYAKLAATRSMEKRYHKKLKERSVELWMLGNGIPNDLKPIIKRCTGDRLQDDQEVDVASLMSILPREHKSALKRHLCLATFKKIQALRNMDDRVIEIFMNHLKPVVYTENTYIIRNGEPLDLMFFITQGVVWTFKSTGSKTTDNCLEKGDFYGEELLNWAMEFPTFAQVPISTTNVKCHTKVEAFYLTALNSKNLIRNYWWLFRQQLQLSTQCETKRFEPLALLAVKQTLLRGKRRAFKK